jgi:ADP-ribose pyrophosphatase YjhB (NUDIX family)
MSHKWLEWAQRIQSLSQAGLAFSKDAFDLERYEELRKISADIMANYTGLEMEKIENLFTNETGYQTPKVDVRGVVFKNNRILLVKEKMDTLWSLPGGFCEVGLSPSENVVKEIQEESGYQVIPVKLLAILDTHKHPSPPQPYHYYKIFIRCEIVGGKESLGIETNEIGFFEEHNIPSLSTRRNTESQVKMVFDYLRNPQKDAMID